MRRANKGVLQGAHSKASKRYLVGPACLVERISVTLHTSTTNGLRNTHRSDGHFSPGTRFSPPQHRYPGVAKKTVAEWEEKARNLSELAAETEERKKALRAGRGSPADILKASERIKSVRDEIAATRRFLEPLVMSCPFCLWSCTPLFMGDDAEPAGERERPNVASLGEAH